LRSNRRPMWPDRRAFPLPDRNTIPWPLRSPTSALPISAPPGRQCRHCSNKVRFGESVAVCPRCGGVNHEACWLKHDGCGSYECAPLRRVWSTDDQPTMRITAGDLAAAPLPPPRRGIPFATVVDAYPLAPSPRRTSGLAIASFVTAVAGIPLFGVVTGVVADGSGKHRDRRNSADAAKGDVVGPDGHIPWTF